MRNFVPSKVHVSVIAALMTIMVRFLAKFLIYVATLLFIVGSIAAICVVWYIYAMEYKKLQAIPEEDRLTSQKDQVDYFLYLAIAVSIIMVGNTHESIKSLILVSSWLDTL